MSSAVGLPPTGLSRLQGMQSSILRTSAAMSGNTPKEVLNNFIKMVASTGPTLQALVTIITPWALLITAVTEHGWLTRAFDLTKNFVLSYVRATVTVGSDHAMHGSILRWMVDEGLGSDVRTLALAMPTGVAPRLPSRYGDQGERQISVNPDDAGDESRLRYVPDAGVYTYTFQGVRMIIARTITGPPVVPNHLPTWMMMELPQNQTGQDTIRISCWSPLAGAQVIRDFLNHVKAVTERSQRSQTTVHKPHSGGWYWDAGVARPIRTLSAITLASGIKETIVKDVESYLDPRTRKFFGSRGIPWRRGFLFYGPPGGGKTSFTTALAGHFKLSVYLINLSSKQLGDERLEKLFSTLPTRCIVLLEDIDSAGIRREDMNSNKRPAAPAARGMPFDSPYGDVPDGITLSGLLNVLDGINSVEGRIIIMTSNNPNSLDEALIRHGRIDRKVLFGYATREVSATLFNHIFYKTKDELLDGERAQDRIEIDTLAKQFASSFPEEQLTPAEVQGFLLDHRSDPYEALENIGAYAEAVLKNRAEARNVSSFANGEMRSKEDATSSLDLPNVEGMTNGIASAETKGLERMT